MNLKTTLLTILLVTGLSLQNCSDDCDCCTSGEYRAFFDIQDIQIKHWNTDRNIIEENEIRFEDYGYLNLHFIVDYIVHQHNNRFNFSLMNSAYGCSPVQPGIQGSKEEAIESFQIITLNDFDEEHKAGESIVDLLEITDIINGGEPIAFEDFLNELTGNVPREYFQLSLIKEPTISKDFRVNVTVNLSTGENYEVTSEIIKFI